MNLADLDRADGIPDWCEKTFARCASRSMPPKLVPRVSHARQHALIGRTRCRCRRGLDKTRASFALAAATEEEVRRHGHSTDGSHGPGVNSSSCPPGGSR